MIALDTTFLIDLYWTDSPRHQKAVELFNKFSSEADDENSSVLDGDKSVRLMIYYNCFNEFVHVITDSRRFDNAFSMEEALDIVDQWSNLEGVKIVYPSEQSFTRAKIWLSIFKLGRNRLNDTNMAACYAQECASTIVTANPKDFEVFEVFELLDYSDAKNA